MKAILTNKVTGERIPVTSTTNGSACSYGQAVWVDKNLTPYCVCGMQNPLYDEEEVEVGDDFGSYVKMARVSRGISVRGMAEACGLSPQTVQNVENGAYSPRLDIVLRMAKILGLRMTIKI